MARFDPFFNSIHIYQNATIRRAQPLLALPPHTPPNFLSDRLFGVTRFGGGFGNQDVFGGHLPRRLARQSGWRKQTI